MIHRIFIDILLAAFLGSSLQMPAYAHIDPIPFMPRPGTMVRLSPVFTPAYLKGIVIHPEDPLKFDFIIYRGDKPLTDAQKKEEYKKLTKYFLASLAIPDENQWVNLSPYEKDRIIKDDFGKTEMGRDLLAQDYLLKQITASLIYPQDSLGQRFWQKVYAQAQRQYHTTNVPVNTFNKVWILPDDALIYEKSYDNRPGLDKQGTGNIAAYVIKNHLRVMLEEDYLALQKRGHINVSPFSTVTSKVIRQIILPELQREVNQDQNFAPLRQIYSGMLLATWFKRTLKQSLLGQIYADKAKLKGIDQSPRINGQIYDQYLQAYKKGVFNFIKNDVTANQTIPRKYFSGGAGNYKDAEGLFGPVVKKTGDRTLRDQAMLVDKYKEDIATVAMDKINAAMMTVGQQSLVEYILKVFEYKDRMPRIRAIDDIFILGNSELETFRQALRLWRMHPSSRIVTSGGVGRLTPGLIENARRAGFELKDTSSEGRMTMQIINQMLAKEAEFADLKRYKIPFAIESTSTNTPENVEFYKKMIETELEEWIQKIPFRVIFIQIPQQQLRAKLTMDKYFATELRRGRIEIFGDTVDYRWEGKPVNQIFEEVLGEALRLIIYADNGNHSIANPQLPEDFWPRVIALYDSIGVEERRPIAQKLFALAQGPGTVDVEQMLLRLPVEQKDFIERIMQDAAMTAGDITRQYENLKRDSPDLQSSRESDFKKVILGFWSGRIKDEELDTQMPISFFKSELLRQVRAVKSPNGNEARDGQELAPEQIEKIIDTVMSHPDFIHMFNHLHEDRKTWIKDMMKAYLGGTRGENILLGDFRSLGAAFAIDAKDILQALKEAQPPVTESSVSQPQVLPQAPSQARRPFQRRFFQFSIKGQTIVLAPYIKYKFNLIKGTLRSRSYQSFSGRVDSINKAAGSIKISKDSGGDENINFSEVRSIYDEYGVEVYKKMKSPAMMAMELSKGGIDLNPAHLNLKIKRDGHGRPLPWPKQDLAQLSNIEGLDPEILSIAPASQSALFTQLVSQP